MAARLLGLRALLPTRTGHQTSIARLSRCFTGEKASTQDLQLAYLRELTDLREPHKWFPGARKMKRKWILHVGPTNSGKTYHALKSLAEAETGAYCGPLRLLAWEVHEKMSEGIVAGRPVPCNLITGQEQILVPNALHNSSTIEMVDLAQRVQVGVVDEIQMIASVDRGWAWTRAILGLETEELHLCGEARAVDLMERLCKLCGDSFEVKEYKRLTPLRVSAVSLNSSLSNVQPGDCVVSFSRKMIHAIKKEVEQKTAHNCCLVYGSLPPSTRKEQARRFNGRAKETGKDRYDVLVASDAVGMGLNLEIKRIVFSQVEKFDGTITRALTHSELLQIAGRAGRFGTANPEGEVTCLHEEDLEDLHNAFHGTAEPLTQAGLRPEMSMLEDFARAVRKQVKENSKELDGDHVSLAVVLETFQRLHTADGSLFQLSSSLDDLKGVAEAVGDLDIPLRDLLTFSMAPVDVDNREQRTALLLMAQDFAMDHQVELLRCVRLLTQPPYTPGLLKEVEEAHMILELYVWLALRFKNAFPDLPLASKFLQKSHMLIEEGLELLTKQGKMPSRPRRPRARLASARPPIANMDGFDGGVRRGGGGNILESDNYRKKGRGKDQRREMEDDF